MVNGHESMTMSIDGLHGPVITSVTDGYVEFLANFAIGQRSRLHFRLDLHQT